MHVPPCLWEKLIHKWRRTLLAPPFLSVNNSQSCSIHNDGFPLHVKVQVQAWQVSRIARVTCAYDSFHTHTQNRIFLMHFCPFLGPEYGQYFYNYRYKNQNVACVSPYLLHNNSSPTHRGSTSVSVHVISILCAKLHHHTADLRVNLHAWQSIPFKSQHNQSSN